jgi:hypothetical protein
VLKKRRVLALYQAALISTFARPKALPSSSAMGPSLSHFVGEGFWHGLNSVRAGITSLVLFFKKELLPSRDCPEHQLHIGNRVPSKQTKQVKMFFSEEKNQKTFTSPHLPPLRPWTGSCRGRRK